MSWLGRHELTVLEGRGKCFWRGGETQLGSNQADLEAIWENIHVLKA